MWGRPEQHDREQPRRAHAHASPGRRPPRERRDRARSPADHDVLRRSALEPDGVDEHVERASGHREYCGQQVVEGGQDDERERQQAQAEGDGAARRDPACRHRPVGRARTHQAIDVAIEHVVERARAAARESAANDEGCEAHRRGITAGGRDHRADRGQHEQRHDPRLGQRHVVAPASHARRCPRATAPAPGGRPESHGRDQACPRPEPASDVRSWLTEPGMNGYR